MTVIIILDVTVIFIIAHYFPVSRMLLLTLQDITRLFFAFLDP